MSYMLIVDEVKIPITFFSENLSSTGNLDFNVSANGLNNADLTSFRNLTALKESMADGHLHIVVKDEEEKGILWESTDYILNFASMSANEMGVSFSASFVIPEKEVITE